MAHELKQDIKNAFITSLTYKVDDKDVNPIASDETDKAEKKIDQLAEDLAKAIATYIEELPFHVEDFKAEGIIGIGQIQTGGGPNLNPVTIKVQSSLTKNEVGLPQTKTNARTSLIKVDKNENEKLSGVNLA